MLSIAIIVACVVAAEHSSVDVRTIVQNWTHPFSVVSLLWMCVIGDRDTGDVISAVQGRRIIALRICVLGSWSVKKRKRWWTCGEEACMIRE